MDGVNAYERYAVMVQPTWIQTKSERTENYGDWAEIFFKI